MVFCEYAVKIVIVNIRLRSVVSGKEKEESAAISLGGQDLEIRYVHTTRNSIFAFLHQEDEIVSDVSQRFVYRNISNF